MNRSFLKGLRRQCRRASLRPRLARVNAGSVSSYQVRRDRDSRDGEAWPLPARTRGPCRSSANGAGRGKRPGQSRHDANRVVSETSRKSRAGRYNDYSRRRAGPTIGADCVGPAAGARASTVQTWYAKSFIRPGLGRLVLISALCTLLTTGSAPPRTLWQATAPPALTAGPLLGSITDTSVKIWGQSSGPAQFTVQVRQSGQPSIVASAGPVTVAEDHDLTGVVEITGLAAATP